MADGDDAPSATAGIDALWAEIQPILEPLEKRRRKLKWKIIAVVVAGIAVLGALTALIGVSIGLGDGGWILVFITTIFSLIIVGLVSLRLARPFQTDFKDSVIRRVFERIAPELRYDPSGLVAAQTFVQSRLFLSDLDVYRGEDLALGRIGETDVMFSEVEAKEQTGTDEDGDPEYSTFFQGLFFVADFNKHFRGETFVLPEDDGWLSGIKELCQQLTSKRPEKVELEDPEFEEKFVVYGTDQVEARYILSTSLMRRILRFKDKADTVLRMSFTDSQIFIAISGTKDYFEPRIFSTVLDPELLREYVQDLEFLTGIVEDLDLNTRIWTKE